MIEEQIVGRGIDEPRLIEAMRAVPRHRFIPETYRSHAYEDCAVSLDLGQTVSQPYIVGLMTRLLDANESDRILEIGTGSGYQTAILATLARRVYSIERVGQLARQAIGRIQALGLPNVKIQVFDGTVGWSSAAPFDRILVAAAAPRVPDALLDQLSPGGRLVIPEGDQHEQRLIAYRKHQNGVVTRHIGEAVRFVPLIGRHGWKTKEATP